MFIKCLLVGLLALIVGVIIGFLLFFFTISERLAALNELCEKYYEMMRIQNLWMEKMENGVMITDLLKRRGYHNIAIYGIGYLGNRLLNQIDTSEVEVSYIIDKKGGSVYGDIPVVRLTSDLKPVDVIIVSSTYYYYEIKKNIEEHLSYDVISIEKLV